MTLQIIQVETTEQLSSVTQIIAEYIAWDRDKTTELGINFDAVTWMHQYEQGFSNLPAIYAPPNGCLLLASYAGENAGCIALCKLDEQSCEMKRLYVRPDFRGKDIAKALVQDIIDRARKIGYSIMRLESANFMKDAHQLYYSFGFKDTAPFREIPDAIKPIELFMELEL